MTNIRRYFEQGQTCFLTHVTYHRQLILTEHSDLLLRAIEKALVRHNLTMNTWAVLPDHIHMLIRNDGQGISDFVRSFKLSFSLSYRHRLSLGGGRLWQYRYWDHIIRDQDDMNRHIDYIHYNPVKHSLCENPFEWPYSSAAQYLERGLYSPDWGVKESVKIEGEFGE